MAKIDKVIRGDSHTISLTFTNGTAPVDITGSTLFFTVNASDSPTDDTGAVIEKTVTSHIDPALGRTMISLLPEDTTSIEPGTYYYDVQLKDSLGNVTSLPKDKFIIVSDITRRTS